MYTDNEVQLLNDILIKEQKIKKQSNKIPKCNLALKNIPTPINIYNKHINKKTLLPSKQSSTWSLKNGNSNSKKNSLKKNIPFINDRNVFSSIRNSKYNIQKPQNQKYNLKKRLNSSEKSRSEKNDDSSCTSRKNLNIDHMYNFKIEYYLIKENINKILDKNIENNDINITNIKMKEIMVKLKAFYIKINEQCLKNEKNENKIDVKKEIINNKEELNKKLLNLYIEKYNNLNKKLQEINEKDYIEKISNELNIIQNEIDFYEQENKELLNNNKNNISNKKLNTLTLPNIKKIRNINNINFAIKNDQELIMDTQLENKINEYKNQISQEIMISKKIKDNEIYLKKNEEIINNLLIKYNTLKNNYEKGIFIEENTEKEINDNINNELDTMNNNNDLPLINTNNNINYNKDINLNYEQNLKEKNNKKKIKNELILIEKKRISKINKLHGFEPLLDKNSKDLISLNKETRNRNITTENNSKLEDNNTNNNNYLLLPYPSNKKKNLSCANISSNINNESKNKNSIKELILKNLDLKEKEEKTLINIHENDIFSTNKFKHIKLKPNFSFNNDYHLFKDEKIQKIPKLQSSVENKNNIIVNLYNNDKDKEELINESIQIEDSSDKKSNINKYNTILTNKSSNININNYNEEKIKNQNNIQKINVKNNIIKCRNSKNINAKDEEKKNDQYSIVTEQREKVLNTIMYDDIVDQGNKNI